MAKIIPDWRKAWRWHSVRWSALGFVLTSIAGSLALAGGAAAWAIIYSDGAVLWLAAGIFLASMIGRIISQPRTHDEADSI